MSSRFLYIAITADARSSVDRDGNKFDKSICSAATTRSSLTAANVCRTCVFVPRTVRTARRRWIPEDDLST